MKEEIERLKATVKELQGENKKLKAQFDYTAEKFVTADNELAKLRAEIENYTENHIRVMEEKCADDEIHCTCVPHLRAEIKALKEELRVVKNRYRDCREEVDEFEANT